MGIVSEAAKHLPTFEEQVEGARQYRQEIVDEYLRDVCHNGTSIPKDNKHFLAEWQLKDDKLSYTVFRFPYDCYTDGCFSWFDVVKEYNIKRWAYIEDLIEKQKEEPVVQLRGAKGV